MSNALKRALGAMSGKSTGKSSKKQLKTESISFLKGMASKEHKKDEGYYKKYGSFEDRFKKLVASRNN